MRMPRPMLRRPRMRMQQRWGGVPFTGFGLLLIAWWYGDTVLLFGDELSQNVSIFPKLVWIFAQAEGVDNFRIVRRATQEDFSEARPEVGRIWQGDGEFILKHLFAPRDFPPKISGFSVGWSIGHGVSFGLVNEEAPVGHAKECDTGRDILDNLNGMCYLRFTRILR